MQTDNEENKASETQPAYNNCIRITSLAQLEEQDRELTRNMSYDKRMQYLQNLISITHSEEDLKKAEKKFHTGKVKINNRKKNQ